VLLPSDDFYAWSEALQATTLLCSDFEPVVDSAVPGDFLFVDPPYTVMHNLNGFVKYNEVLFSWEDQLRLAEAMRRANRRGVSFVMTNANHTSIRKLYKSDFRARSVERRSLIAGALTHRTTVQELLIGPK
jgi:DNA adenine methylase